MSIADAEQFAALLTSTNAQDRDKALRRRLADGVWQRVIVERPELRRWLAFHGRVPEQVLAELSRDPDAEVRWAVAYSPRTIAPLLATLSRDPDWRVRTGVAGNRRAPRWITRALLADPVPQVALTARGELSLDGVTGEHSPRTAKFDMTRWAAARCYRYWWMLATCLAAALVGVALHPVLGDKAFTLAGAAGLVALTTTTQRLTVLWRRWRPRHDDIPTAITYTVSIS